MTERMITALPAVYKLIEDTERLITKMTGFPAKIVVRPNMRDYAKNRVIAAVCEYFGYDFLELAGKSRKAKVVLARQLLSYQLYKQFTDTTYHSIGHLLNRDHSSIMYAVSRFKDLLVSGDPFARSAMDDVERMITQEGFVSTFSMQITQRRFSRGHKPNQLTEIQ